MSRKDKKEALELRRKNKSYKEISRLLGVPKSTLSDWFRDDEESKKLKLLLSDKNYNPRVAERIRKFVINNKARWEQWREDARIEARKEFSQLSKNSLFIAGIMLYWAEGDSKIKNPFRFTNTNPKMIALYTKFLMNILKISPQKIRVGIILYPDLSEKECLAFWSKTTNIPSKQFHKTQFIEGKHPISRLKYGICLITIGSRQLKEKFLVWVDLLNESLYNKYK